MATDLKKYYSISEVAKMFNVNESLLRYWQKEFPNINPRTAGRNVRQYSQEDIDEVRLVYNLVKVRGMKIALAREALSRNREGVSARAKVMDRLERVRAELMALKKELDRV